jgi:N12 class adenine-specific DNA methylase
MSIPVSNSMTELYTMMRYLQYPKLREMGLEHFDSWASTFGETTTSIELSPEGLGYRARTRFAKFYNLPEFMSVFKESADIKTADMLNLPKPDAEFTTIAVEPTAVQKALIRNLAKRTAAVRAGRVDPRADNMLAITTDGRKIGLDQRLINERLPDAKHSKVNACAENIKGEDGDGCAGGKAESCQDGPPERPIRAPGQTQERASGQNERP